MTKGLNLAEMLHVVNALPPVDLNGGKNTDVINLKNYAHVSFIVQIGVSGGAVPTVKVQECDDAVPTNTTDIAFAAYKEETADGDTLGARTAIAATGLALSTNNNIFYVIEVDASQLTDGYDWVRLSFSDPAASVIGSVVAILSGPRYANDQSATAIA